MGEIIDKAIQFKKDYPLTICWRIKKHAKVLEDFINPDEKVIYVFCGQNNNDWRDITSSCVVCLTNKRILIGQKRVTWGSFYNQITPDLYNDMQVFTGIFFGRIVIDTVKEKVNISNLDKRCLDEIETAISDFMMKYKKKSSSK